MEPNGARNLKSFKKKVARYAHVRTHTYAHTESDRRIFRLEKVDDVWEVSKGVACMPEHWVYACLACTPCTECARVCVRVGEREKERAREQCATVPFKNAPPNE